MKIATLCALLLLASIAAAQSKPKNLYIKPVTYRDGQYLDEGKQKNLTKEFAKQCPDLVTVTRFPGAVYEVQVSYYGEGNLFNITDLFRLDVIDPDPIYRTTAVRDKNAVKDICNYLRSK